MLTVFIPGEEYYDEVAEEFGRTKDVTLTLEHSLVSISKWEAKYNKPFLSELKSHEKTDRETLEYVKMMTITQNVPDEVYLRMPSETIEKISSYIYSKQTATTVNNRKKTGKKEVITSEIIYYWMFSFNIPMECQKWHLNRLLTLIEVFSIKNAPKKKMSRGEAAQRNRALNAARRKKYNTNG